MPPEDEQTLQLLAPGVAEAAAVAAPAADPMAVTLSARPDAARPAPHRELNVAAAPAARVGRELGPVRLLREIGRGATGSVILGHHTVLGRDVAVKFLDNVRALPDDPAGAKRFLDEARAAAAVRHPNLTQVYHADVDDADGTPYLVLEYVRGPTLKQLLDRAGPFEPAATVAVVCDAAAAVHELHGQGLIHRDVKPSNVLLGPDGHVFVTDFGLAVRQSHGPAGAGPAGAGGCTSEFAGTPAYMAPEMFDGRASPRSDVYALGVMTFQLLTGSVPFSGAVDDLRDRHVREPLPSEALRAAGVPAAVIEVLERCTHKQPMFRYKTPTDLARALRQASGCTDAELARARKFLCDSIAGRRAFAAAASPANHGATVSPDADDERPGSTSYPEMLARFATVRRERRTHPAADGDGSSVGPLAPPEPAMPSAEPAGVESTRAGALASTLPGTPGGAPAARSLVPGPVLAASILGILYGSLLAAWVVGEAVGATAASVPALGPRTTAAPLPLAAWHVLIAAVGVVLSMVLIGASAGCFNMRPWARRLMARYAAVDLAFQILVLLSVFAWAGPVTVNALSTPASRQSPTVQAALELSVYVAWILRWLAMSAFPAGVLAVMTRRGVRRAFPEPRPS